MAITIRIEASPRLILVPVTFFLLIVEYLAQEFLSAEQLIYLTDVAGVLDGEKVLSVVACQEIDRLVQCRVVSGGMVLKLEAAKRAIEGGVRQVRIVGGTTPEALLLASHPGEVACVPGTRVLRHSESAAETAFTAA